MSLMELSEEAKDLAERARHRKLSPDEYGNGSITVSNLGMFGVELFIPIINPGETVIIGVGRIADTVVPVNGGIGIRKMMPITLSCDHRVVDGAVAAAFFQTFRERLEAPESLLARRAAAGSRIWGTGCRDGRIVTGRFSSSPFGLTLGRIAASPSSLS
jgi:pyruvate dehydrogenase E2 component (dihydrolipoamide acetyltransferase)